MADSTVFYAIMGFATLITAFTLIRLTVQRCHDFNKSGWYAAFAIVPFANIVFALIPGTNGLNQYGEVPQPAGILFKILFYAVILICIALLAYALVQLFNNGYLDTLLSV